MKRLSLLALAAIFMLTAVLSGCYDKPESKTAEKQTEKTTKPPKDNEDTTGGKDSPPASGEITYKQSPMLDGKDLPAVADRLPKEPKLVNEMPADQLDYEIGRHGGTLRTVRTNVDYDAETTNGNMEWLFNTPGILGEEITGNIFKAYEMSADEKEFTFHMREGLKWSDGVPVTVADVEFTVNDVIFNKDITPVFPSWLQSGGEADGKPVVFEKVDDYTFKMKFDKPYAGFIMRLTISGFMCYNVLLKPKHYLQQFHVKYTPLEKLEPLIKKAAFKKGEWVKLFQSKDMSAWESIQPKAIGFPVLTPWMLVERTKSIGTYERNPYYFKVDAEGNQLPYIDKMVSTLVQDLEMVNMKIISGEVDLARELPSLAKIPLYKENEEKGGFKVPIYKMQVTPTDIHLNLTYNDPVWRKVVQDVRFRKALNLALNREEIIDTIYYGFAKPSTYTDSTFNLKEANKLLDEMGMKKGPDGFRLSPDGKKFKIPFEIAPMVPDMVPQTELIVEMWGELGLNVTMKSIDSGLWGTRNAANKLQATMIWTHTPLWYAGDFGQGFWAPLWQSWYTSKGKKGEEPPEEVKHLYQLIDKLLVTNPEEARETFKLAMQEVGDNYWYFNHLQEVSQPIIMNAKLGNAPNDGLALAVAMSAETLFYNP